MSSNESAAAQQPSETADMSKGKAVEQHEAGDMSMDDDDESSGEDSGVEEVRSIAQRRSEVKQAS